MSKIQKPLGGKAYGSIPHLPESRLGSSDHSCHDGQARICTVKSGKNYRVIVTEKLDGGNVAIAKIDGKILALSRAGYLASTSPFLQHHMFDKYVNDTIGLWDALLRDGESLHMEWLAMAHGTRYLLNHGPAVAFDIKRDGKRVSHDELFDRCSTYGIQTPNVISDGPAISVPSALEIMGEFGAHGAIDPVEGAVWRVEAGGEFNFMAKYVKHDKVDGKFIPEISGCDPFWNWRNM